MMMVNIFVLIAMLKPSKKLSKEEFDKTLIKCFHCETTETKYFKKNCQDCCGVPCWHTERKNSKEINYCCDC